FLLSLYSSLCHLAHRALHSFPTRRSSDLGPLRAAAVAEGGPARRQRARDHDRRPQARHRCPDAHGERGGFSGLEGQCSRRERWGDRKSTRLNSSHVKISYAVFCLKKKKKK